MLPRQQMLLLLFHSHGIITLGERRDGNIQKSRDACVLCFFVSVLGFTLLYFISMVKERDASVPSWHKLTLRASLH